MTAPDSRDSVERVVAEMRRGGGTETGWIGIDTARGWADRLQALARGPQQAGGEDWLSEAVAVVYPDTGLRNDEAALAIWRAHMYDTGGEPLFSADMVEALQAEVARLTGDRDSWRDQASDRLNEWDSMRIRAEAAEAALREAVTLLRETGRFLDPRHYAGQIGKLTAFLDKAALNGGQDNA